MSQPFSKASQDTAYELLKENGKKVFPKPTLKRNPREGMCLLSGDEKSSQEDNLVRIETDSELENEMKKMNESNNLVELKDDEELENSMLELDC